MDKNWLPPPPKKKSGNLFKSFPSRYVTGTVEMDVDKFMNWVGDFSDVNAALIFAASGGIPLTSITSGGQIIKVQFEHVWVEAWIDYLPSRGARHKTGKGDTWVSLDASYKKNTPMPLVMAFSFTFHKRSP
ncbi:MAG: transglutaminase domain-containing protein [Pseudomonadota bacterium]|nr:transglutaminase domain-containing protein [Pseudomonadota bacterium]